ncbi:MAG: hypothetical protein RLZZ277_883 [Actinomycetota bacterium]|jgi:hypothetical protein
MHKSKLAAVFIAIVFGFALISPVSASADVYCSSFGTFSSCVENPYYNTPAPVPQKPLPKWVCHTVVTATAVMTLIPAGTTYNWISRIIFVPTLTCEWN